MVSLEKRGWNVASQLCWEITQSLGWSRSALQPSHWVTMGPAPPSKWRLCISETSRPPEKTEKQTGVDRRGFRPLFFQKEKFPKTKSGNHGRKQPSPQALSTFNSLAPRGRVTPRLPWDSWGWDCSTARPLPDHPWGKTCIFLR